MKKDIKNNNSNSAIENIFSTAQIPFPKSKDEVWQDISNKLDKPGNNKNQIFFLNNFILKYAAVIIGILGLSLFYSFYSKSYVCLPGEHISVVLPDKSRIELNAQSSLKYFPLRWQFNRKLFFEGEGFFNVEKGKKFEVKSVNGKTMVLGTSFNIFSRENIYKVTCLTGKVKVISTKNIEAIIEKDQQAEIDLKGNINIDKQFNSESATSWIDNMFLFTSIPLKQVFKEVERQYNVVIELDIDAADYYYTGFFTKGKSITEVLDLICIPLDLVFTKNKNGEYTISKYSESGI